ncbi:GNAT family N-acetyltransferase [Ruegeria hyattellae]|uniref:GNAT family N-acetyltransferase n=1 Tax=Ruegeria hyattellae TaxID=3233337 RepID=UPI00355C9444
MIRVRMAERSDMAAVDALLARSYPRLLKRDYPPSVLVTALPLISKAQPALFGCGTYYVAEEGDAILGAGGWTRDRRQRGLGHIRHVVTDHRALRRGVGRAILAHALAQARAAGITEMECWSTRTAVSFYAAMGFQNEGPMQVPLQAGISFPAIRMRQRLS